MRGEIGLRGMGGSAFSISAVVCREDSLLAMFGRSHAKRIEAQAVVNGRLW